MLDRNANRQCAMRPSASQHSSLIYERQVGRPESLTSFSFSLLAFLMARACCGRESAAPRPFHLTWYVVCFSLYFKTSKGSGTSISSDQTRGFRRKIAQYASPGQNCSLKCFWLPRTRQIYPLAWSYRMLRNLRINAQI
jgi:hypothetical protein